MHSSPLRFSAMPIIATRTAAATCFALAAWLLVPVTAALAQGFTPAPPPGVAAPSTSANPVCQRLEAQLSMIDRGGVDPAKADQIKRYEDSAARQQSELEHVSTQARRMGCDSSGFFSMFNSQNAQCGPVNTQIQQMRANLEQITSSLERLRGSQGTDRDMQRRSVTVALAQNNCGPQYANAARSGGGFLENLFNPGTSNPELGPPASTFKTVCVRTCDGFYFPISFATVPSRFGDDERTCKAQCPAADATLYTHRNPGEDMSQAVSISGQLYSQSPNAFKYRTEVNSACSCRSAGQSWSDALKGTDDYIEHGDIVVTEESAKQMQQRDAQGRPIRTPAGKNAPPGKNAPAAATKGAPADAPAATTPPADRPIRTVGPTFLPANK